jgi:hypothetical protein
MYYTSVVFEKYVNVRGGCGNATATGLEAASWLVV